MTQVMYDVPDQPDIAKVTITPACVKEHAAPELERDSTRQSRPRLGAGSPSR